MKDILKLLKTDMLTESEVEQLTEKLNILVEDKVNELVDEKVVLIKEELELEYNEKLYSHIDEVTSNFSDFMDKIIEEELEIPEQIIEFARKGELYTDLIEDFKVRLSVDEGHLDDEIREAMIEAKNEIESLKESLNSAIDETIVLKEDNKVLTAMTYINEKCDGLTVGQKLKVTGLLDGLYEKDEIDRKYDLIIDTFGINESDEEDDEDDDEGELKGKGEKEIQKKKKSADDSDGDEDKKEKEKNENFNTLISSYKKILTEKV